METYVVKRGETIGNVMEALNRQEDFEHFQLLPKQEIYLPTTIGTLIGLIPYSIKENETMDSICMNHAITKDEFVYFNSIDYLILKEGQEIKI